MQHSMKSKSQEQPIKEKPAPIVETIKEEPEVGWPSFGQLPRDLFKLVLESLASVFLQFTRFSFQLKSSMNGLTPLKDTLIMPEDVAEPPLIQKHGTPAPLSETLQAHNTPNPSDRYTEMKPPKMRSSSFKDPSLTKNRSKRQEYAEFYGGSNEVPPYVRSKSQKERTKHRQRDKSGEVGYGVVGAEHKPADVKPVNFDESKYGHYNMRGKYAHSYRFD